MALEVTDSAGDFDSKAPDEDMGMGIEMMDSVSVGDPVRMYLEKIGRVGLLTAADEVELAKRIESGDDIAKQQFIEATCGLWWRSRTLAGACRSWTATHSSSTSCARRSRTRSTARPSSA